MTRLRDAERLDADDEAQEEAAEEGYGEGARPERSSA
jgi:hypothetical protein